jgi:hypothetical protein
MTERKTRHHQSVEELLQKAGKFLKLGKLDQARFWLKKCLELEPNNENALVWLTKVDFEGGDPKSAYQWAIQLFSIRPTQSYMENALSLLLNGLEDAEREARIQANQPLDHKMDIREPLFKFRADIVTSAESLIAKCGEPIKATHRFLMYWCALKLIRGEYDTAEDALRALGNIDSNLPYRQTRFKSSFFESLEASSDADIFGLLPLTEDYRVAEVGQQNVFFMPSDLSYFMQYTLPLALSLLKHSPLAAIHVHVMLTPESDLELFRTTAAMLPMERVRITTETFRPAPSAESGNGPKKLFHVVRFIRLYQFLSSTSSRYWLLDVDALCNRDPSFAIAQLADAAIGFRLRPGRNNAWSQISACCVAIRPTSEALAFIRLVAGYLAHFIRTKDLAWGIDQLAFFAVYQYLERVKRLPMIVPFGPDIVDVGDYDQESVFWFTAGERRQSLHSTIQDAANESPLARYKRAYLPYLPKK